MVTTAEDLGIFRRSEIQELTGLSDNSIRRLIESGEFPQAILISPRAVGWRRSDIRAWLDSRPIAHLAPVPRKAKAAA